MQWEYMTIRKIVEDHELNEVGADGWELVGVVSPGHFVVHYIFKREAKYDS